MGIYVLIGKDRLAAQALMQGGFTTMSSRTLHVMHISKHGWRLHDDLAANGSLCRHALPKLHLLPPWHEAASRLYCKSIQSPDLTIPFLIYLLLRGCASPTAGNRLLI